jgi:hypothetical protein
LGDNIQDLPRNFSLESYKPKTIVLYLNPSLALIPYSKPYLNLTIYSKLVTLIPYSKTYLNLTIYYSKLVTLILYSKPCLHLIISKPILLLPSHTYNLLLPAPCKYPLLSSPPMYISLHKPINVIYIPPSLPEIIYIPPSLPKIVYIQPRPADRYNEVSKQRGIKVIVYDCVTQMTVMYNSIRLVSQTLRISPKTINKLLKSNEIKTYKSRYIIYKY